MTEHLILSSERIAANCAVCGKPLSEVHATIGEVIRKLTCRTCCPTCGEPLRPVGTIAGTQEDLF